ncbi:MAG: protein kinase [Candidatus Obscuribacterales bacterium]|nr:protein kinase [Candidatus Obscuribacterales bacterium]
MARILVAEDDEQVRDSILTWFTHIGEDVVVVPNGDLASDILKLETFDVLILDWEMPPGKTGPEVVQEYRDNGGDAIVILLTGRSNLSDKERGFDVGVDDYMVKPFHLKELSAKVKAMLKRVQPAGKKNQRIKVKSCDMCGTIYDAPESVCPDCFIRLDEEEIEFLGGPQFDEKYQVSGVLGRGGMSIVFKAKHRVLNKDFAIKFMDVSREKDIEYIKRFELEAQTLSKMNHPHVVGIHDYGVSDSKHPYIVMDYVEGLSLYRALNRLEPFPMQRSINMFKQACAGIGHAHKMGIIHRDLKPANIILGKMNDKEHTMIVDFGVAKRVGPESKAVEQLTKEGKVFGTTTYMSPEHCLGQELDQRSDIYAFGCIMYEVLSGHPPFVGDNVLDTLQKQINDKPLALRKARDKDDLPEELEGIIHKTLEKLPEHRYQSMDELLHALEEIERRS